MKAVYISEFTGIDALELRDVPDPPAPAAGEALVHVKAAGLNRADLLQIRGLYPPPAGVSPNIPGLEFAGEIAAVGSDVDAWKPGDRVFAIAGGGGQAEMVVTDAALLMRVPENLNFDEAAAVPEAFITAHDAVFTQAELKGGETLLIHAVGSGVGLAALKMAKARGAFVIGTSRTRDKLDRCRKFGLDRGIVTANGVDLEHELEAATDGRGVDVILDLVGAVNFQVNLASLAVKGRMVLVGLVSGRVAEFDLGLALRKRLKIIGTALRSRTLAEKAFTTHAFADEFLSRFADGAITPDLDRVFPAENAKDAYRFLESNESFGKVVLTF